MGAFLLIYSWMIFLMFLWNLSFYMRERRGSASRTVVRERLQHMAADGIVITQEGLHGVIQYSISEEVADRWFRLLGLRR